MILSRLVFDRSTLRVHRISMPVSSPSDDAVFRHFSRQNINEVHAGLVKEGESEQ